MHYYDLFQLPDSLTSIYLDLTFKTIFLLRPHIWLVPTVVLLVELH